MKKIYCMIAQVVLLLWFFLDMTGLYFGDKCLVTRSYKEDGIFFLIYLATIILFFTKEKLGKWLVIGWMSMWFVIQFMCHEWYTIFNSGFMGSLERKIEYFSGTIQWLQIEGRYVPDVYHTILHVLILCTLTVTIIYTVKNREKGEMSVDELNLLLQKKHVPKYKYNLVGTGRDDERLCLKFINGKWNVYYSERGVKTTDLYFDSESKACQYILHKLID